MSKSFRFVLAICVMACFGALLGCGGGGGSGTSPVADNNNLTGNQVLNGFVSGNALNNNVRASVRSLVNPRVSIVVQAGYFDASGIFQPFPDGQASGTTDANGMYTLYNLPNRLNIVIRAMVNAAGATDDDKYYFVVVPSVPATGVASAPTMDPNSKYQAYLVREGNKLGVDLNIADILSIIPPSELAEEGEIAAIVGHFVNREKARDRTATNFGVSAALMAQWKNAGFEYSRTIIAQMEKGEITRDEGWRMINQFMAEKAKELGIPPDALMAFQDCDDQFIRTPLQTAFQGIPGIIGDFNRDFEIRKHLDVLNGLRLAFQAFKGTLVLSEADALKLETLIAELTAAIQRADTADRVGLIFRGDVNFKRIFDTVNLILKGLGLFQDAGDGTPLMSKIQFLDDAGALQLVGTAFPTNPNPEQMAAYQATFREKLMAKIALYNDVKIKIKLNEAQIKALVFLLQGLPKIDMPIAPPAQPGQEMPMTSSVIMGVIEDITANPITVNNKVYNFAINPPPGSPAAPEEFGGHLALVDFQQPFALPVTPDPKDAAYVYAGRYVDPPTNGVAPTFLITGLAQTEAGGNQPPVIPEGTFVGQLLKEVANVPHPYYLMNTVPGHTNEKIVLWGNNVDFATLEAWIGQNPPVVVKAVGTINSGGPEVAGIVTLILDCSTPPVKMDTANAPVVVAPVPLPKPVLPNPLPTTFTGVPVNFQGTWISDQTPANKLEVTATEVTLKNDAGVLAGPYKHDPVNRQFMQLIQTANGTVLAYGQVSISDVVIAAWTSIVAPNAKLYVKSLENGAEVVESFHK